MTAMKGCLILSTVFGLFFIGCGIRLMDSKPSWCGTNHATGLVFSTIGGLLLACALVLGAIKMQERGFKIRKKPPDNPSDNPPTDKSVG
ncbi:MAG: hypothetical protein ACKVUS_10715 [Saprospiraceae bacterium]